MNLTIERKQGGKQSSTVAEQRKKKIVGQDSVKCNGKVYYWCNQYKQPNPGFPNSLYICSHKPENHTKQMKNKFIHFPKKTNTSSQEQSNNELTNSVQNGKKLIIIDKLKQVLITTQPNLSTFKVDAFINEVLKE